MPSRFQPISALFGLPLLAACTTNAASHSTGSPAPASSSASRAAGGSGEAERETSAQGSAPSAGVCEPGEGRCEGDVEARACSDDGSRWVEERCGDGAVCVAGRCASLALPKGADALRRQDLFAVAGDGWLNGWSIAALLRTSAIEAVEKEPSAAARAPDRAWKPACGRSGYVPVFERLSQKPKAPEHALLAGYLVSGRARKVALKAGFGGRMRVYFGDRLVMDEARPASPKPFHDEVSVDADLAEGATAVTVLLDRTDEAAHGLWLRLKEPDGRPLRASKAAGGPALLFAHAAAPCPLSDIAAVELRKTPVKGGFTFDIRASFTGLSPRPLPEPVFRAELTADGKESAAREVAKGRLAGLDPSAGGASFTVTPPGAGDYELAAAIGPAGELTGRAKLVYRGDLHDRIVDLSARSEALAAAASGSASAASRESFLRHAADLTRALAEDNPDRAYLAKRTKDAEAITKALGAGEDPYRSKTGIVYRAYRSELDGQLQPYVVFVPPSYKPDGKPMPLILTFHGLESLPEHALRVVHGQAEEEDVRTPHAARHLPSFPDLGVFVAAPWGYGKAGQRQLGEHDVMRVVREMRESYRIDEQRIAITGASLGGTVSFVVPLHYPDVFSAAAPLCGYPNLLNWTSVRSVPHAPWEDVLLKKRYIGSYAENGLHLPLHIVHGGKDVPERSKVIADRYRALGYAHKFDVQDDLDHNVWDYGYEDGRMIAWLKAQKRPERPLRARLVTGEYRYSKAYWVRLIAMRDDAGLAEIDARYIERDREVRVATRNVAAFALDLAGFAIPADTKAVVDGEAIPLPERAGAVFFEAAPSGGAFARVEQEPSRAGKKRPNVAGPLNDVLRHPLLIVYGTQDPAQTDANRAVAEHYASYDHWAYARFPIKADAETTPDDLTGKSLVLIGNPASNRVTAELIDALPVRFEADAITLRGKRFPGRDVGVSLIYPHPKSEGEYVVLHAGVGERGTLASRHLPQLVPDYLVYDARITAQRGDTLLDKRAVLDGGFFDASWR